MTTASGWVFTARARRDFTRLDPPIQRRITDEYDEAPEVRWRISNGSPLSPTDAPISWG